MGPIGKQPDKGILYIIYIYIYIYIYIDSDCRDILEGSCDSNMGCNRSSHDI